MNGLYASISFAVSILIAYLSRCACIVNENTPKQVLAEMAIKENKYAWPFVVLAVAFSIAAFIKWKKEKTFSKVLAVISFILGVWGIVNLIVTLMAL